jgi:hypothetical protein
MIGNFLYSPNHYGKLNRFFVPFFCLKFFCLRFALIFVFISADAASFQLKSPHVIVELLALRFLLGAQFAELFA